MVAGFRDGGPQPEEFSSLELPCGMFRAFVVLDQNGWQDILNRLPADYAPVSDEAIEDGRKDHFTDYPVPRDLPKQRMSPSRQAGFVRWRCHGVLIPFSHPLNDYNLLNP
jgi:hypothetical protein